MNSVNDSLRVVWLLQVAGTYWQPIMSEFTQLFPQTIVFTGQWPGFIHGFENSFTVKQVGKVKVIAKSYESKGYVPTFTYLSPKIVGHLLQVKPDVIFSTAFSIWTILALLLKPLCKWRVIIMYDGSSPGVDYRGSWFRLFLRRRITRLVDAFITNNCEGKTYLVEVVGARENCTFARPYLLADLKALSQSLENTETSNLQLQRPIFLFVGLFIPRKGLHELLKACSVLQRQGYRDYTLLIVGDGYQREELEVFVKTYNLENQIKWVGPIEYSNLGAYFRQADVFVFPTLEDIWGLVAVEAMVFGKPILCSKWAGAVEMVIDGENGYVFDPHDSEHLAELMSRFMNNLNLINKMGEKSKQIMANHTPEAVSKSLAEVVEFVMKNR